MTNEMRTVPAVPTGQLAGTWKPAASGSTFTVHDPATGLPITTVADCAVADGAAAMTLTMAAQQGWAETAPRVRAEVLRRLDELMRADRDRLAEVLVAEVGKSRVEALGEVAYAADFIRWYAEEAVRAHGRSSAAPDGQSQIVTVAEPVGPCLLITPWNAPLAMAARKVGPALAAGCTAILKPPDLAPLSSLVFADLALSAGVPPGVLCVLPTSDAVGLCRALMSDRRLRKVSFTGSTAVGKALISQSAERVLRVSMELGGNAPFIVFDDADLELAVREAMVAKMRNAGQSCVAANVVFVQDGIADDFVSAFAERVSAVAVGPPHEPTTDIGPLIDARAVQKAQRLVDDALGRGAMLAARGAVPPGSGHYFSPTVLDHVPTEAAITREEVFGPVAPVVRFRTESEALRLANRGEHGLAGYVMSRDFDRATRVGARLRVGMVGINRGLVSNVAAPFGGIRESGLGSEGGPEGMAEYLEYKYYAIPRAAPAR